MSTIGELVQRHHANPDALTAVLVEREDQIKERLHAAGAQFGLMPFIVTAVLTDLGVGTEPSEEEKALIRQNYINGMRTLQEGGDPMVPPEGS